MRSCPRRNQRSGWHRLRRCSRVNPLLRRPVSTTDHQCVGAGLPANTVAAATVNGQGHWPAGPALSRVNPLLRWPVSPGVRPSPIRRRSGFTREYGGGGNGERPGILASRPGPFAGEPAPTMACVPPVCVRHRSGVGAGLPANTVAAATVNGQGYWPAGPALSRVNPLLRWPVSPGVRPSPIRRRSGFTREYGGGGNGCLLSWCCLLAGGFTPWSSKARSNRQAPVAGR